MQTECIVGEMCDENSFFQKLLERFVTKCSMVFFHLKKYNVIIYFFIFKITYIYWSKLSDYFLF